MDKEKMNGRELTEKELEQVRGGECTTDYVIKETRERKKQELSSALEKMPGFKAGNAEKEGVK